VDKLIFRLLKIYFKSKSKIYLKHKLQLCYFIMIIVFKFTLVKLINLDNDTLIIQQNMDIISALLAWQLKQRKFYILKIQLIILTTNLILIIFQGFQK